MTQPNVLPAGVLFDFSGTLFHNETPEEAITVALGEQFLALAPRLRRFAALNGMTSPAELPPELVDTWHTRDLSSDNHRAAYSGLAMRAGLDAEQARRLYDRGVDPLAWSAYPDTAEVLRRLRAAVVPVAVVSNIGWDPRPVLARHGVADLIDSLVLSDERGLLKPAPEIFRLACAEIDVAPADALMVGDNSQVDGGATAIGCRFAWVPHEPQAHGADALLRAVGM